jgi:hypothetical protein
MGRVWSAIRRWVLGWRLSLTIFNSSLPELSLLQTSWASSLNPLLTNPLNGVNILKNVVLKSGNNQINHLLGRVQQGWFLTDIQGSATVYRSKPFNDSFITLNSSANVTVNIGVF